MNAGRETKMLRGAIWACAIPMGLGFLGLILTLFSLPNNPAFTRGQPFSSTGYFFTLPIVLCFIFGTPLAAWLACLRLRRVAELAKLQRWRMPAWWGLLSATAVHFGASLIYTIFAMALFMADSGVAAAPENDAALLLFMSLMMNTMLWVIITLPLSLICATIFWRVTKFPEDRSVF